MILVVEEQPYLWALLQERIARATAYVRAAAPTHLAGAWERCHPWPWIVVGATAWLPPGLRERLAGRPVPVHWLGRPPSGLPAPATAHQDWQGLVAALGGLNDLSLNGVRLLRNRGLVAPDGRVALDVPILEGLLAAPAGLAVALDPGLLARTLRTSGLPLAVERDGAVVRLRAAA